MNGHELPPVLLYDIVLMNTQYLTGTVHKCKSCPDFDYCFKCIIHRAEIHDPTHEFESFGPIFDESDSAEDKDSDNSDDTESEASIALGSD